MPLPELRSGIYLEEHSRTIIFQLPVLNSLDMSQNSYQIQSVCATLREIEFNFQTGLQAELSLRSLV